MSAFGSMLRGLGRWFTWPLRGHTGGDKAIRVVIVLMVTLVAIRLAENGLHRAWAFLNHRGFSAILAIAALVSLVILAVLLRAVHRQREIRRKNDEYKVRSHVEAGLAAVVAGSVIGALPSALISSPAAAAVVTLLVLCVTFFLVSWLSRLQSGEVPWWAESARSSWKDHPELALGALVTSVCVMAAAIAFRVPGGDVGFIAGAVALAEIDKKQTKARIGEEKKWRWRAEKAWGQRVSHVRLLEPSKAYVELAKENGVDPPERGARIKPRDAGFSALDSKATVLKGFLDNEPRGGSSDSKWIVRPSGGVAIEAIQLPRFPSEVFAPIEPPFGQYRLPIGVGRQGEKIVWELEDDPHALVVGQTGSGKTVCLVNLAMQALLRGWQVGVIEASKGLVDFADVDPWMVLAAKDLREADDALNWLYYDQLKGVRAPILTKLSSSKMSEAPSSLREPPFLLIIDEYFSLIAQLASKTPLAKADNVLKDSISDIVGRIVREGRSADVHLVLAAQRPDANVFKGEMKSNLGFRVLAGAADNIARQMAFKDPFSAPLPPKGAKGRAVVESSATDACEVQLYNVATSKFATSGAPLPSGVLGGNGVPKVNRVPLVVAPPVAPPDTSATDPVAADIARRIAFKSPSSAPPGADPDADPDAAPDAAPGADPDAAPGASDDAPDTGAQTDSVTFSEPPPLPFDSLTAN